MHHHDYFNRTIDPAQLSPLIAIYVAEELKNPNSAIFKKMQNDEYFTSLMHVEMFERILLCLAVAYYVMLVQKEAQQKEEMQRQVSKEGSVQYGTSEVRTSSSTASEKDKNFIDEALQANAELMNKYPAVATWLNYQEGITKSLVKNLDTTRLVNDNGQALSAQAQQNIMDIVAAPLPMNAMAELAASNNDVKKLIESQDQQGIKQLIFGNVAMKELAVLFEVAKDGLGELTNFGEITGSQILAALRNNKKYLETVFGYNIIKPIEAGIQEAAQAVTSIFKDKQSLVAVEVIQNNQATNLSAPEAPLLTDEEDKFLSSKISPNRSS